MTTLINEELLKNEAVQKSLNNSMPYISHDVVSDFINKKLKELEDI